MTLWLGRDQAKKFGDLHETYPGNPRLNSTFDLYNNEVGRQIGDIYRSTVIDLMQAEQFISGSCEAAASANSLVTDDDDWRVDEWD